MATNGVGTVPIERIEAALEKNKKARIEAFTKDLQRLMKQHRVTLDLRVVIDGRGVNREIIVVPE